MCTDCVLDGFCDLSSQPQTIWMSTSASCFALMSPISYPKVNDSVSIGPDSFKARAPVDTQPTAPGCHEMGIAQSGCTALILTILSGGPVLLSFKQVFSGQWERASVFILEFDRYDFSIANANI